MSGFQNQAFWRVVRSASLLFSGIPAGKNQADGEKNNCAENIGGRKIILWDSCKYGNGRGQNKPQDSTVGSRAKMFQKSINDLGTEEKTYENPQAKGQKNQKLRPGGGKVKHGHAAQKMIDR